MWVGELGERDEKEGPAVVSSIRGRKAKRFGGGRLLGIGGRGVALVRGGGKGGGGTAMLCGLSSDGAGGGGGTVILCGLRTGKGGGKLSSLGCVDIGLRRCLGGEAKKMELGWRSSAE